MKIITLLSASVAALVSSQAYAADAIVAAEPEALEYVRVCDAFGTGFFYIPGSETCLKISGYVRFQVDFERGQPASTGSGPWSTSDWNAWTRAHLEFDARSETELGTLRSLIALRGQPDHDGDKGVWVEEAFIELGGLTVGKFYSWWDNDLSGEGDTVASNSLFNSIRYQYDSGTFQAGISVDELEGISLPGSVDNNIGVAGNLGFSLGAVSANLIGGYDTDRDDGAVRLIATADLGPGSLGFAAVWASGVNAYYAESEWAIAGQYAVKASDKLGVTGLVQYSDNVDFTAGVDKWTYGLTVDYAITSGLAAKVAVVYDDLDGADGETTGFIRLDRSF